MKSRTLATAAAAVALLSLPLAQGLLPARTWARARPRAPSSGEPLTMSDDMFKRIGRIAKDKVGDVKMPTSNPLGGAVGGAVVGGMLLVGVGAGQGYRSG